MYGAGKTPFGDELAKPDWRCTVKPMDWVWGKPGKIFIHFFKWPGAKFELAGFNGQVEKAYMLADPDRKPLKCSVTENELSVELPEKATDEIDSVLCIEVKD